MLSVLGHLIHKQQDKCSFFTDLDLTSLRPMRSTHSPTELMDKRIFRKDLSGTIPLLLLSLITVWHFQPSFSIPYLISFECAFALLPMFYIAWSSKEAELFCVLRPSCVTGAPILWTGFHDIDSHLNLQIVTDPEDYPI